MAGSPDRAGAPRAEQRTLDWRVIVAVLALAALVRALRIWSVLRWSEDDMLDAIPAIQILHGTFPLFHLAVEYAGASKAYVLAVWFALAGTSTVALDAPSTYLISYSPASVGATRVPSGPVEV